MYVIHCIQHVLTYLVEKDRAIQSNDGATFPLPWTGV